MATTPGHADSAGPTEGPEKGRESPLSNLWGPGGVVMVRERKEEAGEPETLR